MVAYAVDALAWCKANLGKGYFAGGCRCEIPCPTQDCSGWIVAATRVAGLWIPCINSAGFAVWGREAGTLISEQEAIWTPFALGIKGPNGGEDGNGPKGHIAPMVGDGAHTYEAMSTARGCTIGSATGRGFVRWMNVPGLIRGPKPPTFRPERTMIIQTHHWDAHSNAKRIRDKDGQGHWIMPTIGPTEDGKGLMLSDGASFTGAGNLGGDDLWMSPDVGAHGRIISVVRMVPQDGTPHLVIVRHADGWQKPIRMT